MSYNLYLVIIYTGYFSMDKIISRKFFNDRAEQWDHTVRNNDPTKLRKMANMLDIKEDNWVLDVGTGTGVFVPYIAEKLNGKGKILCMDYAINMLIKANSKNQSKKTLSYICSEIENFSITDNRFDVATCYSTFPHFHNKSKALKNLKRLLKTGGVLYICHTASKETINDIHRNIPDFSDHLIPENEIMEQLLSDAGFSDINIDAKTDYYLTVAFNK